MKNFEKIAVGVVKSPENFQGTYWMQLNGKRKWETISVAIAKRIKRTFLKQEPGGTLSVTLLQWRIQ